jgi:hypothetical protein
MLIKSTHPKKNISNLAGLLDTCVTHAEEKRKLATPSPRVNGSLYLSLLVLPSLSAFRSRVVHGESSVIHH